MGNICVITNTVLRKVSNYMSDHDMIVIILVVHMIGFIIATIIHVKCGTYEDAVKYGGINHHAEPADVLFQDLLIWEVNLVLFISAIIGLLINDFFYYIFRDKMKEGNKSDEV